MVCDGCALNICKRFRGERGINTLFWGGFFPPLTSLAAFSYALCDIETIDRLSNGVVYNLDDACGFCPPRDS